MITRKLTLVVMLLVSMFAKAQNNVKLPFYELPEYPESYTAGTVAGRMVESLGFRYYWATEGLTEVDLVYKPNNDVRSTSETIDHIYNLSLVVVNATLNKPNSKNDVEMTFEEQRIQTLLNLQEAANILNASDDISQYKIIFGTNEIPFWNEINGPIADAIWHCGQIASFRRSSGNPINPKVDQFNGKVKP
ncbi:hypothetical protein [Formosa maritima]|uniref:DinB family protein n=1 Tax=Formosa maritima TaxID=2592046 RepID=A0A5D0GFF5_9FLAO|nr:hypothetical protein [Formosa maritima]TYA57521.1 hypothetical protein FVF61_04645 [Formosa maritima]